MQKTQRKNVSILSTSLSCKRTLILILRRHIYVADRLNKSERWIDPVFILELQKKQHLHQLAVPSTTFDNERYCNGKRLVRLDWPQIGLSRRPLLELHNIKSATWSDINPKLSSIHAQFGMDNECRVMFVFSPGAVYADTPSRIHSLASVLSTITSSLNAGTCL